jgi:hypothetical protein
MHGTPLRRGRILRLFGVGALLVALLAAAGATQAVSAPAKTGPKFTKPAAFDVSKPLRELAEAAKATRQKEGEQSQARATSPTPPFRLRRLPRRSQPRCRTSRG